MHKSKFKILKNPPRKEQFLIFSFVYINLQKKKLKIIHKALCVESFN